jgi:hypothetical protein
MLWIVKEVEVRQRLEDLLDAKQVFLSNGRVMSATSLK